MTIFALYTENCGAADLLQNCMMLLTQQSMAQMNWPDAARTGSRAFLASLDCKTSKQRSKQASKQASKQTNKQASKQASKRLINHLIDPTSISVLSD